MTRRYTSWSAIPLGLAERLTLDADLEGRLADPSGDMRSSGRSEEAELSCTTDNRLGDARGTTIGGLMLFRSGPLLM
jgi:hypothetical protein